MVSHRSRGTRLLLAYQRDSVRRVGRVGRHARIGSRLLSIHRRHRHRIRRYRLAVELTVSCRGHELSLRLSHPRLLGRSPVWRILVPRVEAVRVVASLLASLATFADVCLVGGRDRTGAGHAVFAVILYECVSLRAAPKRP